MVSLVLCSSEIQTRFQPIWWHWPPEFIYFFIPVWLAGVEPAEMGELGRILRHPLQHNQIFKDASRPNIPSNVLGVRSWPIYMTIKLKIWWIILFLGIGSWMEYTASSLQFWKQKGLILLPCGTFPRLSKWGTREFGLGVHSHKDSSKSITMMSHAGRNLAKKLEIWEKELNRPKFWDLDWWDNCNSSPERWLSPNWW